MDDDGRAFDRPAALEMVEGNLDILVDLAKVFLDYYPKLLLPLDEAISKHDTEALAGAAHDLKGAVGFFGPTSAASTAIELEQVAHVADIEAARKIKDTLREQVENLATELRQLVDSN